MRIIIGALSSAHAQALVGQRICNPRYDAVFGPEGFALTLGAHAQRGLEYCLSVSLSLCYHVFCLYAQRRYENVCCCNGFIIKKAIIVKLPRLKVMVSKLQISIGLLGPQSVRWRLQSAADPGTKKGGFRV